MVMVNNVMELVDALKNLKAPKTEQLGIVLTEYGTEVFVNGFQVVLNNEDDFSVDAARKRLNIGIIDYRKVRELAETNIMQAFLVHELVHIDQINEGRYEDLYGGTEDLYVLVEVNHLEREAIAAELHFLDMVGDRECMYSKDDIEEHFKSKAFREEFYKEESIVEKEK